MGKNKRKAGEGGADAGNGGKKAKTNIHKIGKYLPGGFPIDPKMRGVMVTCARGKETQAGAEACDLLSEVRNQVLDVRPQHTGRTMCDLYDLRGQDKSGHGSCIVGTNDDLVCFRSIIFLVRRKTIWTRLWQHRRSRCRRR